MAKSLYTLYVNFVVYQYQKKDKKNTDFVVISAEVIIRDLFKQKKHDALYLKSLKRPVKHLLLLDKRMDIMIIAT